MSTEFSDSDKEVMVKAMGQGMGQALKEVTEQVKKDREKQDRLVEQRYESTLERLVKIEAKVDQLLNYPQTNKITLDKILELVDKL